MDLGRRCRRGGDVGHDTVAGVAIASSRTEKKWFRTLDGHRGQIIWYLRQLMERIIAARGSPTGDSHGCRPLQNEEVDYQVPGPGIVKYYS